MLFILCNKYCNKYSLRIISCKAGVWIIEKKKSKGNHVTLVLLSYCQKYKNGITNDMMKQDKSYLTCFSTFIT